MSYFILFWIIDNETEESKIKKTRFFLYELYIKHFKFSNHHNAQVVFKDAVFYFTKKNMNEILVKYKIKIERMRKTFNIFLNKTIGMGLLIIELDQQYINV